MLIIDIDLNKSLEENAAIYFDKAKRAKKKIEGAKKALEDFHKRKQKEDLKKEKEEAVQGDKHAEKNRKRFWFEKYKWFISSDNFLVIAGKDATSNEDVIKKHADAHDLVFHTDAPGSSFVVVKTDKKEVPDTTKVEAAVFTGCNSKAWSSGFRTADVFMVKPDQVTKETKAGEFIGKGSFMIYGKRTNFSVNLSLAVGMIEHEKVKLVMVGPDSAVKSHAKHYVLLKQGDQKKGDITKKLMHQFKLHTNDDLLSQLPSGKFDFVKVK